MPRFELHATRHLMPDERHALARAAGRGDEIRLRQGVYGDAREWAGLGDGERMLARIAAAAATSRSDPVWSHWSAAALHGLPTGLNPDDRPHRSSGGASAPTQRGVVTHLMPVPDEDVVVIEGLRCTSLARTAVEVAASGSFEDAVMVADAVLHRIGRETVAGRALLIQAWERAQPRRANGKVARVVAFADERPESPNESMSRITMDRVGAPAPVLQQRFFDRRGFVARTDFFFPEFRVIGEADGRVKYLDPRLTPDQAKRVLYDEKLREDRLRAMGFAVVRWGWREAVSPAALAALLRAAGIPVGDRWR